MLLRMRDIQPQLQQKWLQLYWPDDSRWWPAQVTQVNPKRHRAQLLYETGLPLHLPALISQDTQPFKTCLYMQTGSTPAVGVCARVATHAFCWLQRGATVAVWQLSSDCCHLSCDLRASRHVSWCVEIPAL